MLADEIIARDQTEFSRSRQLKRHSVHISCKLTMKQCCTGSPRSLVNIVSGNIGKSATRQFGRKDSPSETKGEIANLRRRTVLVRARHSRKLTSIMTQTTRADQHYLVNDLAQCSNASVKGSYLLQDFMDLGERLVRTCTDVSEGSMGDPYLVSKPTIGADYS
jgi:hypothetical protein